MLATKESLLSVSFQVSFRQLVLFVKLFAHLSIYSFPFPGIRFHCQKYSFTHGFYFKSFFPFVIFSHSPDNRFFFVLHFSFPFINRRFCFPIVILLLGFFVLFMDFIFSYSRARPFSEHRNREKLKSIKPTTRCK